MCVRVCARVYWACVTYSNSSGSKNVKYATSYVINQIYLFLQNAGS